MTARQAARAGVTALVAALVATLTAYAVDAAVSDPAADALGPGAVTVTMSIDHSRFSPERLTVRAGTLVRFVVENGDPIHHELIVGPPDVHARHATGTERFHPPVPGEVAVGPNGSGMTVYAFDEPGTVEFACHLPGHLEYGMRGTVEIIP